MNGEGSDPIGASRKAGAGKGPRRICAFLTLPPDKSALLAKGLQWCEQTLSRLSSIPLVRRLARPKLIVILLVSAVSLCLSMLVYVQRETSGIINRDMQTAVSLSEIAARFDREDGEVYRLMAEIAVSRHTMAVPQRIKTIQQRLRQIDSDLVDQRDLLSPEEQIRVDAVSIEIRKYADAVGVVGTMLEIDSATSATMLRPFRDNAEKVLRDVRAIAASAIADAHFHARDAARRIWLLASLVTLAVLGVALLCYTWLSVASERGRQLRDEIARRSEAEQEALTLARIDSLTGLVNRRVFENEMETALADNPLAHETVTIMLLDLDGFKGANDVFGHAAGDATLVAVANILREACRIEDVIARLGGDEFAILMKGETAREDAQNIASRLCTAIGEPIDWQGHQISIGASIGIARYPEDGQTPDALLHCADLAMYQVKQSDKGDFRLFTPDMEADRSQRSQLEDELRHGIENGEVVPFYQPIVSFPDQILSGYEVLARWKHPRLGLVAPDTFIPLAERSRQMLQLTIAVLRQACTFARTLPRGQRLAFNVSPSQLLNPSLADSLLAVMREEGVDPAHFEIEITEDAVMDDVEAVKRVLDTFRANGLTIALDDFGTGYSSLSHLRRLRFDRIKIDRTFVSNLDTSRENAKLVEAIIGMAQMFDMKVTAEGVEDDQTALLLASKGCTNGQGYHFGRPSPGGGVSAKPLSRSMKAA